MVNFQEGRSLLLVGAKQLVTQRGFSIVQELQLPHGSVTGAPTPGSDLAAEQSLIAFWHKDYPAAVVQRQFNSHTHILA